MTPTIALFNGGPLHNTLHATLKRRRMPVQSILRVEGHEWSMEHKIIGYYVPALQSADPNKWLYAWVPV